MEKTTIKSGSGRFYGVINSESQPGKILNVWDEDILLLHAELDEAFELMDRYEINEETGEEEFHPGPNLAFVQNLQIETDGKDLTMFWQ
jgi:hypothetical protein